MKTTHSRVMPKIVDLRARVIPLAVALLMAGPFACSETLSAGTAVESEGGTGLFIPSNDGASLPEPDAGLTAYCAMSTCPSSLSTCQNSRFSCDVDLMTDPRNCGSCGFSCNMSLGTNASFDCIEGRCAMTCSPNYADCNGVVDDDCEVKLGSNDNCNGCGDKCLDPAKPCIFDTGSGKGHCGCDPGFVYCGGCVDPTISDKNCGGCGISCDATGDGGASYSHTYYGCANSECGHLKCEGDYANCDDDIGTGCETSLLSANDCGSCGKVCDPGQTCIRNRSGDIECACPPGKTLCGIECVDVLTNPRNCGACEINCLNSSPEASGIAFCSFGSCNYGCAEGRGDCNGDSKDGCETNLASDPRNCGGCGITCDLAGGQPCVHGRCAVEACDGGVVPR